jgi:hypothetical protein
MRDRSTLHTSEEHGTRRVDHPSSWVPYLTVDFFIFYFIFIFLTVNTLTSRFVVKVQLHPIS